MPPKLSPSLIGFVLALLFPALKPLAAGTGTPLLNPTSPAPQAAEGLARPETATRLAGETNGPPAAAIPTGVVHRYFDWEALWQGWDGLHFTVTRKTFLGQQVTQVTNLPVVHLAENRLSGKVGAKFAVDAASYATGDNFTGFDPGFELRRARLYAKGGCLLLIPFSYEIEIGYIPHTFYLENSYLEFHNLGFLSFLGSLKGGQFQVPMGLANYGSSRDMMFMERAAPVAALASGVNAGLQVGRPVFGRSMTWALGLFTDGVGTGKEFGEATKGFGRMVGRVTGVPVFSRDTENPNSQRLLHLGLSGSMVYAGQDVVRYRTRPESHLAPVVVDTGDIDSDGAFSLGAEAAWVQGPLCVQGEMLRSWVDDNTGGEVHFSGFYGSVSWFLTGETRPYDRAKGTFGRVIPRRPFDFGRSGWGAWELAGRYSYVDLNSGPIHGGRLGLLTAGVNWHLQSHVKWRFDYGFGRVSDRTPKGNLNIFQTRIEVDF